MIDTITSAISAHAQRLAPSWIELRQELHRHPELSGQEFQTTNLLADRVSKSMSIQRPEQRTGFWADQTFGSGRVTTAPRQHRMAIRADIDALPIQTQLDTPYASRRENCMHACGHDVHASVLVAASELLAAVAADGLLSQPISLRAVFQPAEETSQGACQMIAAGALDGVSRILALHVDPSLACGQIGIRRGALTANCDAFEVTFQGSGGHSARPHLSNDVPSAVAHWITHLHARLPRTLSAFSPTVASVGMIQCGEAANVLPTEAIVRGTLRSTEREAHENAWQTIYRLSRATAELFDCNVRATPGQSTPGVINDASCVQWLREAAESVVGATGIYEIAQPSMGAEDFAFYLNHTPGAMFRLGVAGPTVGNQPLHTPLFDIDERAIAIGACVFANAVIQYSLDCEANES